jgi:hypothetical protein
MVNMSQEPSLQVVILGRSVANGCRTRRPFLLLICKT